MKLSIAFITSNRKKELLKAINSCIDKIHCEYEIVIVDNKSTDGCESYIKSNTQKDINYYYSDINLGVAGGRNKAYSLSKGEYVFFLDDDAIVIGDAFFDRLIMFMDANHVVVAASPNIQEPQKGTNLNSKYVYQDGMYKQILSYCGCAHILRKQFFDTLPCLYPNNLQFGSEELYSSIMSYANDKIVVEIEELLVEHYPSMVNRVEGDDRKFNFIFNQYIIKRMLYPKNKIWLTKLFFTLHKAKHHFIGIRWNRRTKEYEKLRYEEQCVNRMSVNVWIRLKEKFGWRIIY